MTRALTVRMYNVGFGDAFLILLPGSAGLRRILVDCGTIKNGAGGPIKDVVTRILADCRDADGVSRLDVVVATHRHKDHVAGFDDLRWQDVEVGEVWMPWTEDPEDPQAGEIRDAQSRLALALAADLDRRPSLRPFAELIGNALANEDAMNTLHRGFKNPGKVARRFLPEKEPKDRFYRSSRLPDVQVHVLGPSRSKDVIKDLDPPIGKSYLALRGTSEDRRRGAPRPFSEALGVSPAGFARQRAFEHLVLSEDERRSIRKAEEDLDPAVAVALESAVNGTSLMLVLQIGRACLLFPGDAQWGTWDRALADPLWRALLKKTRLFKVGHHGSHNATPVEFVEKVLGRSFAALVSTHSVKQWPYIPKEELLLALQRRASSPARIVRSDQIPVALKAPFSAEGNLSVDVRVTY